MIDGMDSGSLVCAGCGQDSGRLEVHTLTADIFDSDLERVGDSVVRVVITVCELCAFKVNVNCEIIRVVEQAKLGGSMCLTR